MKIVPFYVVLWEEIDSIIFAIAFQAAVGSY